MITEAWRIIIQYINGKNKQCLIEMGTKSEVEMLEAHAQLMRESLSKSQRVTETMITILGSFNRKLSSLETTIQPTQVCVITYVFYFVITYFIVYIFFIMPSSSSSIIVIVSSTCKYWTFVTWSGALFHSFSLGIGLDFN